MKSSSWGLRANSPESMAPSMRGRSCITTRPAPMFIWPTSELPIWPAGNHTASSQDSASPWGASSIQRCQLGAWASVTALQAPALAWPQPSRMHSTTGRGAIGAGLIAGRGIDASEQDALAIEGGVILIGHEGDDLGRIVGQQH